MEKCFEVDKSFEIDNPFREDKKIKVKLYGNKISISPNNSARTTVKIKLIKEEIETCQSCKYYTCCTAVKINSKTIESLPSILPTTFNDEELNTIFYKAMKAQEFKENFMLCKYDKRVTMEKLIDNLEEIIQLEKEVIENRKRILKTVKQAYLEGKLIKINGGGENDITSSRDTAGN